MVTGVEFGAAYVFYSESATEQIKVEAELKANGILTSGSLSGSLQASLEVVQKRISTRQSMRQFLHGFSKPKFPPADEIINFALGFGTQSPDAPVVLSYNVTGYEHVPRMPASFSSIAATRTLYNGLGDDDGLADADAELKVLRNSINSILSVYETYEYSGIPGSGRGSRRSKGTSARSPPSSTPWLRTRAEHSRCRCSTA